MTIEEQIELVNKWFEEGKSKQEIENELGMKYDSWRKRVYRKGYRFNKELNQWLLDNTNIGDDITPTNTHVCDSVTQDNANISDDITPTNTNMCDSVTHATTILSDDITHANTNVCDSATQDNLKDTCDDILQDNTNISDDITHTNTFSTEEVQILKKLISNYKTSESINDIQIEDDEILTRSVRVYKNQFDKFAKYCKDNNINQSKALAKAIDYLLENA